MTDPAAVRREAHPLCREWLRLKGRPYPKSSCQECGTLIRPNFRCAHGLGETAAVRPAEATGDAERVATRHRLREIILGWSGMDESDLGPIVDAIMRDVVVPVEQARDAAEAHTHAAHGEVARLTAERDAVRELRDKWQREMSLERRLRSTCELHLHRARQKLAALGRPLAG